MPEPRIDEERMAECVSRNRFVSRNRQAILTIWCIPGTAARGAVETTAPPTPRNRLQRIAYQLSYKKNFDHSLTHRPAHDPPKCARFGDKIMHLLKESAIGRKTGSHFC